MPTSESLYEQVLELNRIVWKEWDAIDPASENHGAQMQRIETDRIWDALLLLAKEQDKASPAT